MKPKQLAGFGLGALGAVLVVVALFCPLIRGPERELVGRDLLDVAPVIAELEAKAGRLEATVPERRFPPGPVGRRLKARAEKVRASAATKKRETRETLTLVADCLGYARWALIGLLFLSAFQLLSFSHPTAPAIVATVTGLTGGVYVAALALLSQWLGSIELLGSPLPLEVGWWLLLVASIAFLAAGGAALNRKNARWLLPLQWLPAVAFGLWFSVLLG